MQLLARLIHIVRHNIFLSINMSRPSCAIIWKDFNSVPRPIRPRDNPLLRNLGWRTPVVSPNGKLRAVPTALEDSLSRSDDSPCKSIPPYHTSLESGNILSSKTVFVGSVIT